MIYNFQEKNPNINSKSFVADNATIIGDVTICEDASIWFGAVLRGDIKSIYVGRGSNIQDNSVVHIGEKDATYIGDYVTVGHGAIVHGATVKDYCLIGMGATLLDGCEIGEYTIIGAGSLVPPGKKIPSGVLCLGSPAKVIRELTDEEKKGLEHSAEIYVDLYKNYK